MTPHKPPVAREILFRLAAILLTVGLVFQTGILPGDESDMELLPVLPQPKQVERTREVFRLAEATRIFMTADSGRSEMVAAQRLAAVCQQRTGIRPMLDRPGQRAVSFISPIHFEVKSPAETDPILRDGYTMRVGAAGIRITGNSESGLFYGIQTLTQLVRHHGAEIPGANIVDSPDFQYRGFYHDISRGKVPKMETLKWLIDYLAEHKINMFQLYVEHPFQFRFDPGIAHGPDSLTPEEVLFLDQYCRERHIDFVPSLQSFGHMAGVFSLDQYRQFADVELPGPWEELTWHQRMSGATIDISNPKALAVLERMHDDFLPLFQSKFVNVCADETYDLGKGKTKALADEKGTGTLYIDHINWLNELCKRYDKKMMFWGDIVKQHPERIPAIPKDTILLNWGYHRETDFESCKLFADAGLDFFVCPGTSGWNRILNEFQNADLNIRRYVDAGKRHGAMGVLNTDWGDHGHFNVLAGSLHGIALGGAMSWNSGNPGQEDFDRIWNAQIFGEDDGRIIAALRAQDDNEKWYLPTWRMLYQPLDDEEFHKKMNATIARHYLDTGDAATTVLQDALARSAGERWILEELLIASRINTLLGEKYFVAAELKDVRAGTAEPSPDLAARLYAFADRAEILYADYRETWLVLNKETDLGRIEACFKTISESARAAAHEVEGRGKK